MEKVVKLNSGYEMPMVGLGTWQVGIDGGRYVNVKGLKFLTRTRRFFFYQLWYFYKSVWLEKPQSWRLVSIQGFNYNKNNWTNS